MTERGETAAAEAIFSAWQGNVCQSIVRHEYSWQFVFQPSGVLTAECPWRIIANGRIALCRSDDGQKFGLPEPVDAKSVAEKLVLGSSIRNITLDDITGDLQVLFENDTRLDLITDSSGYEAWQAGNTGNTSLVIGMGGGGITIFSDNP